MTGNARIFEDADDGLINFSYEFLTQAELPKRCGFKFSSSDIRIRATVRADQRAQNSAPKITQNNFPNHSFPV
jgi:hypothetical protein